MTRLIGAELVTVTRYAAGTWTDGDYVRGAASTFDVKIAVQPLRPREREQLPEGQRTSAKFKAYVDDLDNAPRTISGMAAGDRLDWHGRTYEVISVEDWSGHARGVPHYKIVLAEAGEPDGL